MSILIQPTTAPLRARPELVHALDRFLMELQEGMADGDLEGGMERIARDADRWGLPITVLPSSRLNAEPLPCAPIVVAVVAKESNHTRLGPKAVMTSLRSHLVRCPGVELVCIVSVCWGIDQPCGDTARDLHTRLEVGPLQDVVGVLAIGSRLTRLQVTGHRLTGTNGL
ncbi:MAG: hypothetical protein ACKO0U_09635 [Gammaproteobacteria bacterium]